ncbi:phosphatase PAP2 family protein [Nonomuraea sp. SBT364]|uniref:phosphatase PAP2 family protein n=1 Tax=Nonomuraea sp. SBT364 TaxID=1580530 RepID=UPI00066E3A4D|nr:phosphatase PAP2 family protein [Nonomuraea sp. SBT364]
MRDEMGLGVRLTIASATVAALMVPFMLLLVVARMPLNELDAGVARRLHAYAQANPDVTNALIVWTDAFGPLSWRVAVVLLAIWLVRRGARRMALWAVTTMAVGGLLGALMKIIVDRARPDLPDPVALAEGDSFPSGHALNVTLGAGVIVLTALPLLRPRARAAAWAIAWFLVVTVACTRVALGVHYVSDVVAGVMLGVAVIAATVAGFERWRRAGSPPPPADRLDADQSSARRS